jgi:hypothetical protein
MKKHNLLRLLLLLLLLLLNKDKNQTTLETRESETPKQWIAYRKSIVTASDIHKFFFKITESYSFGRSWRAPLWRSRVRGSASHTASTLKQQNRKRETSVQQAWPSTLSARPPNPNYKRLRFHNMPKPNHKRLRFHNIWEHLIVTWSSPSIEGMKESNTLPDECILWKELCLWRRLGV